MITNLRFFILVVATLFLSQSVRAGKSDTDLDETFDLVKDDCPAAFVAFDPIIEVLQQRRRPSEKAFNDAAFRFATDLKACASRGVPCCQRYLADEIQEGGFGLTQDKNLAFQLYLTAAKAGDLDANYRAAKLARELSIKLSFNDFSGVRLNAKRGPSNASRNSTGKTFSGGDPGLILDELADYCPSAHSAFHSLIELSKRKKRPSDTVLDDAFWKGADRLKLCASKGESCCQNLLAEAIEDGFGFSQDKNLSLQLYLTAAEGGDLEARESAQRLSKELGIELDMNAWASTEQVSEADVIAANPEVSQTGNFQRANDQPPNSSPVSAFIDLSEFRTPRSAEIARNVLYGSEAEALQEARVCALDGDAYCTYLCGLLNEHGAPGVEVSQRVALSRYRQAASNGVVPAARAVSRLNGDAKTVTTSTGKTARINPANPSMEEADSATRSVLAPNPETAARKELPSPKAISASRNATQPQDYSTRRIYRGGVEILSVEGPISIEINAAGKEGKNFLYDIRVFNFTSSSLDVSPEIFYALQGGDPVRVHSYAEMEKKLKTKHRWQKVGTALAIGIDAYSTGRSAGRGYGSGSFSGDSYSMTRGHSSFSGAFSVTFDDPVARELAFEAQQQRTRYLVDSLKSKQGYELSRLANTYLRHQTVQPREGYAGTISIQRSDDRSKQNRPIVLEFSLNGQPFRFDLSLPE